MLIDCKMLCANKEMIEIMGDKAPDVWLDTVINLKEVAAITRTDEDVDHEAKLYMKSGEVFVIDVSYLLARHLYRCSIDRKNDEWVRLAVGEWNEQNTK